VLIAILALACSITQAAESASDSLCVATYNLRFASSNGPNAWPDRRPIMRELIQKMSPDLLGTQEGVYYQLQDLAADLPDYAWVGTGREGGLKGEFMAIFYRKARLQPLSTNHFWLSDTPEVPASSTWGNKHFRMVTWMKVRDLQTRREFYFFNTHFDHLVQVAREKSAALVRQRITDLNTSLPVILTGDFNAIAGRNKAYDILVGDGFMFDTWGAAKRRTGEGFATFNGFKAVPKTGEHIDWILARGAVSVDSSEVSTFSKDGQFPSDHCPVLVQVRLGPARTQ
jgi:endonuclease/exonuclease/phosphatase family metal-dependent hydrolase